MRRGLALGAVTAVLVTGSVDAAPVAGETRSCVQVGSFFNVHVSGHKLAGYWLRLHSETFAQVPADDPVVAVWSFGSQETRAPVLYAWSTAARSDIRARCRLLVARPPTARGLWAPFSVREGWSLSRRYECALRGRLAIRTEPIAGGTRMTVWMERSRQVAAVADLTRDGASLRASRRCAPRSV